MAAVPDDIAAASLMSMSHAVMVRALFVVDSVLDAADGVYPERQVFDKALEIFRAQGPIPA